MDPPYSSFAFTALGKAKNVQIRLSDEWLRVGAKQYIIFACKVFFLNKGDYFEELIDLFTLY